MPSMAGCSTAAASPFDSVVEILHNLQKVGFCSGLEVSNVDPRRGENLTPLFNHIVSVFLKESDSCNGGKILPLPVLLGNGRSVDLFKLYTIVEMKGGYDAVTEISGWRSVAKEAGLEQAMGPSLKLVFFKYLDALDQWLQRIAGKKAMRKRTGYISPFSNVVPCNFPGATNHNTNCESTPTFSIKNHQFSTTFSDVGSDVKDVMILGEGIDNKRVVQNKRKRQSLVGLLDWIRTVAEDPMDPCKLEAVPLSKGNGFGHLVVEFYDQALLARQARYFGRTRRTKFSLPESGVASANQNKAIKSNQELQLAGLLCRQRRIPVPVGARYQAEVPIWTCRPPTLPYSPDTLKWLGTRTWPPENHQTHQLVEYASIGRGRLNICCCDQPGSLDCIRLHIAEKRLQLKRELGDAFNTWTYECMGEDAALSWTDTEKERFRDIFLQYRPSLNDNLWNQLYMNFPCKERKTLVNYYFNVFLLGWRRYQNRVTPENIDSDGDETDFGFICNSSPHATKICDSKFLLCVQNQECRDIDV